MRQALQALRNHPGSTAVAVLSIAVVIAANATIFSFLDSLFLRPLPQVEEPNRMLAVYGGTAEGRSFLPIAHDNFRDLRDRVEALSDLAAYQMIWVGVTDGEGAEQLIGEMTTDNYFDLLGVDMTLGRTFAAPDRPDHSVVLSHGLWRRWFEEDPGVLGRVLRINGHPFTITGVAERGFRGCSSFSSAHLWVPISAYRSVFLAPDLFESRSGKTLQVLGRLEPGIGETAAASELAALAHALEREHPEANRGLKLSPLPLPQVNIHPNRRPLFAKIGGLFWAVGATLLVIACANVGTLLLLRACGRMREFATRLAVGASKADLAGRMMREGAVIAVLGSALGLLLAKWSWGFVWSLRPPYLDEDFVQLTLSARILTYTGMLAIAAACIAGAVPLLWLKTANFFAILREESTGASRLTLRLGRYVVASQVALCTVAVGFAMLFSLNLARAQDVELGFETEELATISFDLQSRNLPESQGRLFQERALATARSRPAVVDAALGENAPLAGFRLFREVYQAGRVESEDRWVLIGSSIVDADYFRTLGIHLLEGRGLEDGDRPDTQPVVVINETMRRRFWGDESPIGEHLTIRDRPAPARIVGVVSDVKYVTLGEDPRPFLYLSSRQWYSPRMTLHIRTRGDSAPVLDDVSREVRALDSELPLVDVGTVEKAVNRALWAPRLNARLLSFLATVGLLLGVLGVYGLSGFAVSQRRQELAVRTALGAGRLSLIGAVSRNSAMSLGIGSLLGALALILLCRWQQDAALPAGLDLVLVIAGSSLILMAAGTVATVLPALATARADFVRRLS